MKNYSYKIGSLLYLVWGLLHINAAIKVYQLALTLQPSMVQGRLLQDAWNLAFFAISASVVAITLVWKNSKLGYLINLVMVSATDIGFIITILMPGYLPLIPGILGPLFWVLAVIFSTWGLTVSTNGGKNHEKQY